MMGQPGTDSEVDGFPQLGGPWTLAPSGVYFVPAQAPKSLRYFDFATKRIRPIFEANNYFGDDLSLFPDGRWILYSQLGDVNSNIMLVDHFR